MRVSRRIAAIVFVMPLGSCAVFGPVVDRSMDDAPFSACGRFEAAAAPAADASAPQCISFLRQSPDGRWLPSASGSLAAGDELIAIPSAAPVCRGGEYTHVVLSGSAGGAGEMQVAVSDAFGRGDRGRRLRWDGPRRRWTVPNIGTANHLPAGIRISMVAGEAALDEACFKSYHHLVRVPPRAETDSNSDHGEH
jgi:hypothetical protein